MSDVGVRLGAIRADLDVRQLAAEHAARERGLLDRVRLWDATSAPSAFQRVSASGKHCVANVAAYGWMRGRRRWNVSKLA